MDAMVRIRTKENPSDVLQDPGSERVHIIIDNFPSFELNLIQRVLRTPTVQ
jgi:hypothetical protein